jgi:hypothetical protein
LQQKRGGEELIMSDPDDLPALAPPDGLSEVERLARSRVYAAVQQPPSKSTRPQFTVAGLMLFSFFACLGLSGSHWMPASVYAGTLGLLMLLAIIWSSVSNPDTAVSGRVRSVLLLGQKRSYHGWRFVSLRC